MSTSNNNTNVKLSRRDFLLKAAAFGAAGAALAATATTTTSCTGGQGATQAALACNDTTGLAPADVQMRTTQAYVEKTPEAGKVCSNCLFWQPKEAGKCGGCQVLKGPIHPDGYCKLYQKKA